MVTVTILQPMVGVVRLSSVSSQDSGFTSQDTLFMKPTGGTTKTKTADKVIMINHPWFYLRTMVLFHTPLQDHQNSFIALCSFKVPSTHKKFLALMKSFMFFTTPILFLSFRYIKLIDILKDFSHYYYYLSACDRCLCIYIYRIYQFLFGLMMTKTLSAL